MAYFLKKVNRNGKVYLSIVDSFYDGSRGHASLTPLCKAIFNISA